MAYNIEPRTAKDFLNMGTNLPRFQRKQTWKPISNFKLCISIFKNYPIGVVIVNKNRGGNWLLDGRQRLNALTQINNNPEEVYKWAMKFIKFKASSQPDEIKDLYWQTVDRYLSKNFEEDVYNENDSNEEDDNNQDLNLESDLDITFNQLSNQDEKNEGLDVLLNLILMGHNYRRGQSLWERTFDFSKIIINTPRKTLKSYEINNGQLKFKPEKLMQTIEDILREENDKRSKEVVTKDTFIKYYCDTYIIEDDDQIKKFTAEVNQKWDQIYKSFVVIYKMKKILGESKIGIIEITTASDLDAQNIFSLVNSGGTQLTAEELLSAKPYWNVKVNNTSKEAQNIVKVLYDKLDVSAAEDTVRWDLCATLISRIDKNGFIFEKKTDKESFAAQTTLGFKLFSALFVKGISSKDVSSIETENTIDWETEFEPLVKDLNDLCDLLESHPYFKCMKSWGQSIMSLTSNTIALEFLTIMYLEWDKIDKKRIDCFETKALKRNAVILLDKLIYEYSNKQWRGSSDSKLASDIKSGSERLNPKDTEDWTSLLQDLASGKLNDQTVTQNIVKPILFHAKNLAEEYPSVTDANVSYEIDHIYPKALFNSNTSNTLVIQDYKDSLCNLQILSAKANNSSNVFGISSCTLASISSSEISFESSADSSCAFCASCSLFGSAEVSESN